MSRHQFTPPGWPQSCSLLIGWDDALESYFALVIDAGSVIASAGDKPPLKFTATDHLMRVVNARIKERLPPVQLDRERRKALTDDAKRPVVNSMIVTPHGKPAQPVMPHTPPIRTADTLGTQRGFLTQDDLRDILDEMAGRFFRLQQRDRDKQAQSQSQADDDQAKAIRASLDSMGAICHLVDSMAHTPGILVAESAFEPFRGYIADADRILQAEADAMPSPVIH